MGLGGQIRLLSPMVFVFSKYGSFPIEKDFHLNQRLTRGTPLGGAN